MSHRAILVLALVLIASSLVFYRVPQIDLVTSGWILAGEGGPRLGEIYGPELELARDAGRAIIIVLIGLSLVVLGVRHLRRADTSRGVRPIIYVLAVLAIGPGLLANLALKDQWGRARPRDVVEFGGDKQFTAAWVMSDQCALNCAFVAGEGAFAFSLLAPAFLVRRRRWRLAAIAAVAGLGGMVSLVRMAQGAHFLSDSVIGALIVALTAAILHRLMLGRGNPDSDEI